MTRQDDLRYRPGISLGEIGFFPAVLVHDVMQYAINWHTLGKVFYDPAARPGVFAENGGDHVFIPFDRKIPYTLKKSGRGWVATEATASDFKNWKSLTKVMGQYKRDFVNTCL
jgi:hypothetical protein